MLEIEPTASDKYPKVSDMTDTAIALGLIDEVWPLDTTPRKKVIGFAFEAVKRFERSLSKPILDGRPRVWTERRVRAIVDGEARRIDNYEIQDLTAVAIEEARLERQRLRAREVRLEAFLASALASPDQQIHQQASGPSGRLDHAGTGGEVGHDRRATDR